MPTRQPRQSGAAERKWTDLNRKFGHDGRMESEVWFHVVQSLARGNDAWAKCVLEEHFDDLDDARYALSTLAPKLAKAFEDVKAWLDTDLSGLGEAVEPETTYTVLADGRRSLGHYAIEWMEFMLIHGDGPVFNQVYRLLPWMKEQILGWYVVDENEDEDEEDRVWQYDEALFGAESGASKTELVAAVGVLEFNSARGWDFFPKEFYRATPIITCAAASLEQAGELFGQVSIMAGGVPEMETDSPLRGRFNVQDRKVTFMDGHPGIIKRVAANAATAEGGKETLVLGDEIHEWKGAAARVWVVRTKSLGKQGANPGRAIGLSTAAQGRGSIPAEDTDPLLWRQYVRGLLRLDPRFLFAWREAPDSILQAKGNPEAIEAALRGMCAPDGTWRVKVRLREILSGKMPWMEALRYYFNKFVLITADSWLHEMPDAWEECEDFEASRPPHKVSGVVAVDMALKTDSVGVVFAFLTDDGRIGWYEKHFAPEPQADGTTRIDHPDVFRYITHTLADEVTIDAICYDPKFFELPAREAVDMGFECVEIVQSSERLVPADNLTFQLLLARKIAHSGDPVFGAHAAVAAWRYSDAGRHLAKSKSMGHIDLIKAASFATFELFLRAFDPNEWFAELVGGNDEGNSE